LLFSLERCAFPAGSAGRNDGGSGSPSRYAPLIVALARLTAMSPIDRKRTSGSPFEGMKPRRRLHASIESVVTGRGGPERTAKKSANPSGLIRIKRLSIGTSSAARTAASRTKSVRNRLRNAAAQSITAMLATDVQR
jgi:hypothetical protein